MSHSPELIQKIAELIIKDYSLEDHVFIFEKSIPGTRMLPDITVWPKPIRYDPRLIKCVVEIGYTRPEKLSSYLHEFNIPDVRWYDKEGNLHSFTLLKDPSSFLKKTTKSENLKKSWTPERRKRQSLLATALNIRYKHRGPRLCDEPYIDEQQLIKWFNVSEGVFSKHIKGKIPEFYPGHYKWTDVNAFVKTIEVDPKEHVRKS